MHFHLYNVERGAAGEVIMYGSVANKTEADGRPCTSSEVAAHGKPLTATGRRGTVGVRVVGLVSPILLKAEEGREDVVLAELRRYAAARGARVEEVTSVTKENIFYSGFERKLQLLRVVLDKSISFSGFESESCEVLVPEFSTAVEQLLVGQGLKGPGICEIDTDPSCGSVSRSKSPSKSLADDMARAADDNDRKLQVQNNAVSKSYPPAEHKAPVSVRQIEGSSYNPTPWIPIVATVHYTSVSFLKHAPFGSFKQCFLATTCRANCAIAYALFDGRAVHTGVVAGVEDTAGLIDPSRCAEARHAVSFSASPEDVSPPRPAVAYPPTVVANTPQELTDRLGRLIRAMNPDIIVFHTLRIRERLPLRGRILCSLFDFAAATVRGRDYSIAELAQLHGVSVAEGLQGEAVALSELFERMHALSLGKELAEISGCMLNRCIENSRSERVEFTLLHELYARNYLFPPTGAKPPETYTGGLVLEPETGFYSDFVLLIDFNSLYPSIIQEFDVCFSNQDALGDNVDEIGTDKPGIVLQDAKRQRASTLSGQSKDAVPVQQLFLPSILNSFVRRRYHVKSAMKSCATEAERMALNIRQLALKLTANSIYGCLGAPTSRFCNYRLAAHITARGRALLAEARRMAQDLGLRVIYGDTDSLMILSSMRGELQNLPAAIETVAPLVAQINAKYRYVEIEFEKAFSRLLLCSKKKYAALIYNGRSFIPEFKGLETGRRDHCRAASNLLNVVINLILTDNPPEEVYAACERFFQEIEALPVTDFVICTVLSKDLEQYPEGTAQPHVVLARRLMSEQGRVFKRDDVISYVVGTCTQQYTSAPSSKHTPQSALQIFHPSETFHVNYRHYITTQILPPLQRVLVAWGRADVARVSQIFGVSTPTMSHTSARTAAVLVCPPCCQTEQPLGRHCVRCGKPVDETVLAEAVRGRLRALCTRLYGGGRECLACGLSYNNHYERCVQCRRVLDSGSEGGLADDTACMSASSGWLPSSGTSSNKLGVRPESSNSPCESTQLEISNTSASNAWQRAAKEFDDGLARLEEAVGRVGIPQLIDLCARYASISAYRIVSLERYFPEEVAAYAEAPVGGAAGDSSAIIAFL